MKLLEELVLLLEEISDPYVVTLGRPKNWRPFKDTPAGANLDEDPHTYLMIKTKQTAGIPMAVIRDLGLSYTDGDGKIRGKARTLGVVKVSTLEGKEAGKKSRSVGFYSWKPTGLVFWFKNKSESEAKEAIEQLLEPVLKRQNKYVAARERARETAPRRRKEAAKYYSERRKKELEELKQKYGADIVERVKVKSMSHEGDDGYQWAMFVDGRRVRSGMKQAEARAAQRSQWSYLKRLKEMTPEERLREINAARGLQAYFMLQAMEDDVDLHLAVIKQHAKELVDANDLATDTIENAKVNDEQARKIYNDLIAKLRKKT